MEQKKYMDIERLKPEYCNGFKVGDQIQVSEKIDGANAAIAYDGETDSIRCFSRKRECDFSNNLRGFHGWANSLDKNLVADVLGDNLWLFGEWLVRHSVSYPEERYNQFYCFDIFDTSTQEWMPQDIVKRKVSELGLNYVPVFYEGEFISWEHIKSFIGRTNLGGEFGEGVVVKSQTNLNSQNEKLPFYVKLVGEKFCETKGHRREKTVDLDALKKREEIIAMVESVVTEARVSKIVNKFIDEGIIPENWGSHDMSTIAKNLGKAVYEDCVKEEPEVVSQIGSAFGKFASSTAMSIARKILNKKEGAV